MENKNTAEDAIAEASAKQIADDRLATLKAEAADLGITFSPNISEKKLQERIDKAYEDREKSEVTAADLEAVDAVADDISNAQTRAMTADQHMRKYARDQEALARKTRIITITDNDQRVNNATTTCTANCSNSFFDLGTIVLPLNEKVEVRQGHIDTLAGVKIPHHVRSSTDPAMSETVMRARYAIHYEAINT